MLKKDLGTGTFGQISWERLSDTLRKSGEIGVHEKVVGFEASEHFLRFKVEYDVPDPYGRYDR